MTEPVGPPTPGQIHAADQAIAAARTLGAAVGAFHAELSRVGMDPDIARWLTYQMLTAYLPRPAPISA
jgi:hypothetical protein